MDTRTELNRLRCLPRYKEATTNILGIPIKIVDAHSFLVMVKDIFVLHQYYFKTDSPRPRIIDGGANIGLSSLYFARMYPDATIIAIEPDEAIFEVLSSNLSAYPQIELIRAALSSRVGTVPFLREGSWAGRVIKDGSVASGFVPTVRLRDLINEPTDLVKLDIEGAELEVLRDSIPYLKNVQSIIVEFHSFCNQEQGLGSLLSILEQAGFRYSIQAHCVKHPAVLLQKSTQQLEFVCHVYGARGTRCSRAPSSDADDHCH